jgi:5-methylcytosine-specific restriction protein B
MDNQKLYDIKNDFLKAWPIERLESITLEEYTNLDKTSFCYWIEHITSAVGSIKGGSSYKFGIYRMSESSQTEPANNRTNNGEFAWHTKYGASQEEAFQSIKTIIIQIIRFSQENNLKPLDNIDLGDAYKWKIAFLYGNFNIINIFKIDSLSRIALGLGLVSKETNTFSELNNLILKEKPNSEDFFDFSHRIWNTYGKENDRIKSFEKWLKLEVKTDSGKINSYLKALNILRDHFKINVYTEDNINLLKELYEDLKIHQKEIDGKYYYSKAKSYGEGGFYSAAVNSYIDFFNNYSAINKIIIPLKFKELIVQLQKYKVENNLSYNLLPHDGKGNFIWLSDKDSVIGSSLAHFEVSIRGKGNKDTIYVDVHFESNKKQYRDLFSKSINELPEGLEWIDWFKSKSIGYKESYKLSDEDNLSEKIFNALKYIDETIGDTIRGIINTIPSKEKSINNNGNKTENMEIPLNQILFGPPGTGKTFNSINEAIKIINLDFDLTQDRTFVKEEFDRLVTEGQIVFTTFHQSMSYEDFIEGIKPKVEEDANENKQVVYEIEDGIFKRLVENAKKFKTASKEIFEYYSFDDAWDDLVTEAGRNLENNSPLVLPIQTPNLGLKIVEISERGNLILKPIYSDEAKEYTVSYLRTRKLQESFPDLSVLKNIDKEFRAVIGGSNSTAYWSTLNFINQKINQKSKITKQENRMPALPHVLIIDEINRGNISQIFGELITLIEDSKRLGELEELEITLSYSKKKFGVPSNVYIIGTMNTADRSIEALDTALRRRFSFKEFAPNSELIRNEGLSGALNGVVNGIDLALLLDTINTRIEKLIDKDHKIGHSYLLKVNSEETLKSSFRNEIIPLLEEYFFGDYGKIGLVLGNTFVEKVNHDFNFASFDEYDTDIQSDLKEKKVFRIAAETNWDFSKI